MDCNLPGSSVHGIFQARILECVAISFSRRSSQPRDWTHISFIGRQILYHRATWIPRSIYIIYCAVPCCTQLYLTLATQWIVAHHTPLSMGFPRQEYWSGLPFPSPGIISTQGLNPHLLNWQVGSLPLGHQESPNCKCIEIWFFAAY